MATDKRKRRQNGFLDVLAGLLTLLVIGIVVGVGIFLWGVSVFNSPGPAEAEASFFVEPNNGPSTIATRLEEQNIIADSTSFMVGYRLLALGKDPQIFPGEYTIPAKASMQQVFDVITSRNPVQYFVMVNPGQSSYEVATLLNDPAEKLSGEVVADIEEGTILPIRHDYFPNADRAELLQKMRDEMTATVTRLWEQCVANRPDVCGEEGVLDNQQEFVILASIVEEETGIASERPIVASLFVNRLRKGMRLETDPTILYGLYRGVPQESLSITESQKNRETPYNTYFIDGLPPTPISNPGVAALEAVANPADTDYEYMMAKVPGDYSKGHEFATTYDQHLQNVARYRVQEREQAAAAEEPASE